MWKSALCVAALVALAPAGARAEPDAADLIFSADYMAKVPAGTKLAYAYRRDGRDPQLAPELIEKGDVRLDVAAGEKPNEPTVTGEVVAGARHHEFGPFPGLSGNPLIMVFLEQDVREMSRLLGGSPFYIRNRIKDAMGSGATVTPTTVSWAGKDVAGWRIAMKPFAKDPNRARLREYAEKSYEVVVSDAVPGGIYAIRLDTPRAAGEGSLVAESVTLEASAP